jgi:hypothetical protein
MMSASSPSSNPKAKALQAVQSSRDDAEGRERLLGGPRPPTLNTRSSAPSNDVAES